MIEYYLSSNNKMCYITKIQTFSPTKHTLRAGLDASRKIFKKIFFHISSIKYRLIIKLITKIVCKLRDKFNEPN